MEEACRNGDLEYIRQNATKKNIDKCDYVYSTPFALACEAGHLECVEEMITKKANVNKQHHCGETPLIVATREGHVDVVNALINAKSDVDAKNQFSNTALIAACTVDEPECVKALLRAGAKVHTGTRSALELAAEYSPEAVKLLLETGELKPDTVDSALKGPRVCDDSRLQLEGWLDLRRPLIKRATTAFAT
jgi:ankyrin repeat protein